MTASKPATFTVLSILRRAGKLIRTNDENLSGHMDVTFEPETTTWVNGEEWRIRLQKVETDRKQNVIRVYYVFVELTGRVHEPKNGLPISHQEA